MLDLLNLLKKYPGCYVRVGHDRERHAGWRITVEKTLPNPADKKKPFFFQKLVPINEQRLQDEIERGTHEPYIDVLLTRALAEVYAAQPGE